MPLRPRKGSQRQTAALFACSGVSPILRPRRYPRLANDGRLPRCTHELKVDHVPRLQAQITRLGHEGGNHTAPRGDSHLFPPRQEVQPAASHSRAAATATRTPRARAVRQAAAPARPAQQHAPRSRPQCEQSDAALIRPAMASASKLSSLARSAAASSRAAIAASSSPPSELIPPARLRAPLHDLVGHLPSNKSAGADTHPRRTQR